MFTYDKDTKAIARDGNSVGVYDEASGKVQLQDNLPPALKGQLRKLLEAEGCAVKGFVVLDTRLPVVSSEAERSEAAEKKKPPTANHKMSDGAGGVKSGAGEDAGEGNEGIVAAPAVPACPPIDPRYGDKTPALVEWCRDHDPAEFVRRYGARKTHLSVIRNVR
jgi:hypothetical protein